MKNSNIKLITKENCGTNHKEMCEMGMYYCPVCEDALKEQKQILITITTKANVIYKEAK